MQDHIIGSDFWWLSPQEAKRYGHVELFHQEPYSDEPNTDESPLSRPLLPADRRYPLEFVSQWKAKFRNINVFRSLGLYTSDTGSSKIIGPFLLDIDRVLEKCGGYVPDLSKALEDTRRLVEIYCSNLKDKDYCIFFTGHKGFHIEVTPRVIGMPTGVDQWQQFKKMRDDINTQLGDSFVDVLHPHVRLHNSINSWKDYSGQLVNAMNFEVSANELFNLSGEEFLKKAESLSRQELDSYNTTA